MAQASRIRVWSSWGLRTLANSMCKLHRALQTLANSVWKCHRPTKILIRVSSTRFTQASAAKMGDVPAIPRKSHALVALPEASGTWT